MAHQKSPRRANVEGSIASQGASVELIEPTLKLQILQRSPIRLRGRS